MRKGTSNMNVKDYLKENVSVGTIVVFREGGHQIGMTRVDNEDLYLHSLSNVLLHLYKVVNWGYEQREWATVDVLVLEVTPI